LIFQICIQVRVCGPGLSNRRTVIFHVSDSCNKQLFDQQTIITNIHIIIYEIDRITERRFTLAIK